MFFSLLSLCIPLLYSLDFCIVIFSSFSLFFSQHEQKSFAYITLVRQLDRMWYAHQCTIRNQFYIKMYAYQLFSPSPHFRKSYIKRKKCITIKFLFPLFVHVFRCGVQSLHLLLTPQFKFIHTVDISNGQHIFICCLIQSIIFYLKMVQFYAVYAISSKPYLHY